MSISSGDVEMEELSYQFFEELGEGLTSLLEKEFGGDSYAAACRVIDWLRNGASQVVLSEIACMMIERRELSLAFNSRTVGKMTEEFACLTRQVRDNMGMPSEHEPLEERFSSLDICRHRHPEIS